MDAQTAPCNNTSDFNCGAGTGPYALIVIPALLAVSTLIVAALIVSSVCCKRRERVRTSVSTSNTNAGKAAHGAGQSPAITSTVLGLEQAARDSLDPWEIPGDCVLQQLEFLHTGRYGPVCKSRLSRGGVTTTVVVKTLREGSSQSEVREFVDLARFHSAVSWHGGLVQMLFCRTQALPMCLILEAVSPGNLLHFLWTLRSGDSGTGSQWQHFSERSVYVVAKQVAAGLEYLLSEHGLVHGDVAARSALIGAGLSVRLAGLGLAFEAWRPARAGERRAAEVPLKWQAPERILGLPGTDRSDVWSFGILLYELITLGGPPYPELEPPHVFPQIQNSYRMKKPEGCGPRLYELMKSCWMWTDKDRPAFSTIISLLKSSMDLAETETLPSRESVDVFEYSKRAGVSP